MEMSTPAVWNHPCYREAVRLFDMAALDKSRCLPSDPHARDTLRDACGRLAAGTDLAAVYLNEVLRRYTGVKYHDALRSDIQRIARAAVAAAR